MLPLSTAMASRSDASARSNGAPPILGLPSELLIDILSSLRPTDVSAFAQTCRLASSLVDTSPHLWLTLYNRAWDPPGTSAPPLPIMAEKSGVKADLKGKGKATEVSPEAPPHHAQSMQDRLKRRTRARLNLRRGARDPSRIRHDETLRTLLDAASSRRDRIRCSANPNLDLPRSKSAATLASMFPRNRVGDARWSAFVYPREKLATLKVWQAREKGAGHGPSGVTRARSSSSRDWDAETRPAWMGEASPPSQSGLAANSPRVRRSARLRLAKVPAELHRFLDVDADEEPNTWLSHFEVNEELAAELHCLHGIRPVSETTSESAQDVQSHNGRKRRRQEAREDGHVSDDSVSASTVEEDLAPAMVPAGTHTGPQSAGAPLSITQLLMVTDSDDEEEDEDWADEEAEEYEEYDEDIDFDDPWADEAQEFDWHAGAENRRRGYGPIPLGSIKGMSGDRSCRVRAKEMIYDCARHGYENAWGPFKPFRQESQTVRQPSIGPFAMDSSSDLDSDSDQGHEGGPIGSVQEAIAMGLFDGASSSAQNGSNAGEESEADEEASETGAGVPAGVEAASADEDFQSVLNVDTGEDEEEEYDEFDDPDMPIIPSWAPGTPRFDQMVSMVGAYAGSKVRSEVEEIRAREEEAEEKAQSNETAAAALSLKHRRGRFATKWQRPRYVNWLMLESIMVATHCSLVYAIRNEGWGSGFNLPHGARGDSPQGLGPEDHCIHVRQRRLLMPASGWNVSRGERPAEPQTTPAEAATDTNMDHGDSTTQPAKDQGTSSKVHDWANVESATWAGTYFFCDYPIFLCFNAERARSSRFDRKSSSLLPDEAVGDCLQVQLELRPPEEQLPELEEGVEEAATYGEDDPEFPTLRFSGVTRTYFSFEQDPTPRGRAHGFVRPVYAEPDPSQGEDSHLTRWHAPSGKWLPAIAGVHWSITHAYEGQDRWRLCGVQAGPPGTRAPIYGTWSDVDNEEGSPVGPFVYFNVDSRPWREVEELIIKEKQQREALARERRAARADRERSEGHTPESESSAETVTYDD